MSNQQKMTEIYRNQNKTKYDPPKVKVSSVYIYFVYSHNKSFDQRTDYWIHCKNEHTTTKKLLQKEVVTKKLNQDFSKQIPEKSFFK